MLPAAIPATAPSAQESGRKFSLHLLSPPPQKVAPQGLKCHLISDANVASAPIPTLAESLLPSRPHRGGDRGRLYGRRRRRRGLRARTSDRAEPRGQPREEPPRPPGRLAAAHPPCRGAPSLWPCGAEPSVAKLPRSGAYHVTAPGSGLRLRAAARHDRLRLLCLHPAAEGAAAALNPFAPGRAGPGHRRRRPAGPAPRRPRSRLPPPDPPLLHTQTHACTHACMHARGPGHLHGHAPRRVKTASQTGSRHALKTPIGGIPHTHTRARAHTHTRTRRLSNINIPSWAFAGCSRFFSKSDFLQKRDFAVLTKEPLSPAQE